LKAKFWFFERDEEDEQKARRCSCATLSTFCEIRQSRSQKVNIAANIDYARGLKKDKHEK